MRIFIAICIKTFKVIFLAEDGIKSLNYQDWQWIISKKGKAHDTYKTLPKMFLDIDDKNKGLLSSSYELRDGGVVLTAYVCLQCWNIYS